MKMEDLHCGRDPEAASGHLIIGDGNLAQDLRQNLETAGISPMMVPFELADTFRDNGFPSLKGWRHIWHCTGGRHAEAKANPQCSHRHNVTLPRIIIDRADPEARICFFSTADCAHPDHPDRPNQRASLPPNEFAQQKLHLEGLVLSQNRPGTAVVRLSSLYGLHRPETTFPGRLLSTRWPEGALISLPSNDVTPTPTDWAAHKLVQAMDRNLWNTAMATIHHLAPVGSIATIDWAKLIFGNDRKHGDYLPRRLWDDSRPRTQNIGTSLQVEAGHWFDLWAAYFKREWYQAFP